MSFPLCFGGDSDVALDYRFYLIPLYRTRQDTKSLTERKVCVQALF